MPVVINGTTGVNTDGQGNLTFSGTGQRIIGDFTGSLANRVAFQTSTTNGLTSLQVIPNGTGSQTHYSLFTDSALTNGNFGDLTLNNSEFRLRTLALGTGTPVPMTFAVNGSERMRIDSSGNVGIGTTIPGARLQVDAAQSASVANLLTLRDSSAGTTFNLQTFSDPSFGTSNRFNYDGGYLAFRRSGTEQMRLDSSGNLLVNTTTNTNSSRIVSNGVVESTTGGFRFPDGTTQTTAAGALTTAAVLSAYAGAAFGAVGSYFYGLQGTGSNIATGGTIAGSSLNKLPGPTSAGLSGTWRFMGARENNNSNSNEGLWLRIS